MFNVLLAASPVLVILIGMLIFKKSAMKIAPITMVYTILLGMFVFNGTSNEMINSFKTGILDGVRIVWLIFAAFSMLIMMQKTSAMNKIKEIIADITNDKRIQVILIAVMFGIFLEGVAGAGTPAAIAAPFLVGLGFSPITAAAAALISNNVPVSWGGAGVTTIMGVSPVSDYMSVIEASSMTGRIHMIGAFILPFLIILVIFGKKGFKGLIPFLTFSGGFMAISLFIFSNFIGAEITSMCTGLLSIVATLLFLKFFNINTPEMFIYKPKSDDKISLSTWKAFSPYLILIILLPVVRYSFSLSILAKYGYTVWVGIVILISAFIGSLILDVKINDFFIYSKTAFKKVIPALIAMCGLLVVSDVMVKTKMMSLLASTLSDAAGSLYPVVAVSIGSLGSFITGTNLGSNIMFGPMHVEAAKSLALNPITIFAGQNAGGALGNMICPNNIVAVATTVGILGKEGILIRKVLPAFLILLILYGFTTLIYTHILFANFGF
ncbi:MAG: L-lactate permease [Firmicutes bacterium]|nr:L-lactate permease [Bacillota bacterium]